MAAESQLIELIESNIINRLIKGEGEPCIRITENGKTDN